MPTLDERRRLAEQITMKLAHENKELIDFLKENGWGVTIFAFELGDKGAMAYLSTVEREDMIKAAEEWLAYQKEGLTTEPPGERAES